MDTLHALLLGLLEGLTEFLPISSTGHLLLAAHFLGIPQTEFVKTFEIFIQLGAILAVLVFSLRDFLNYRILLRLFTAFLPTAVIGLLLHDLVKTYFFESLPLISWALLIGGFVLVAFEYWNKGRHATHTDIEKLPLTTCAAIGLFQCLAMIPGVSRSGATIVGGLLLKVDRPTIARFSFLVAVPTMGAAVALDTFKGFKAGTLILTPDLAAAAATGFIAAFIVALLVLRFLMSYIKRHTFIPFGIYRILIGGALLLYFFSI